REDDAITSLPPRQIRTRGVGAHEAHPGREIGAALDPAPRVADGVLHAIDPRHLAEAPEGGRLGVASEAAAALEQRLVRRVLQCGHRGGAPGPAGPRERRALLELARAAFEIDGERPAEELPEAHAVAVHHRAAEEGARVLARGALVGGLGEVAPGGAGG